MPIPPETSIGAPHSLLANSVSVGSPVIGTAKISTRMNFAVQHHFAAARFSRSVTAIENAHAGEEIADFWDEILHNSVACVFSCAASLESYANEMFVDRDVAFPSYRSELLDKLWETFELKPILEKFEFALLLREKRKLDRGTRAYESASALIELRNALTHFKPEWTDLATRHRKLSKRLDGKFSPSPFLNDELVFPRRWATQGCTKWAVETVLSFAREFEALGDMPPKYDNSVWKQKFTA